MAQQKVSRVKSVCITVTVSCRFETSDFGNGGDDDSRVDDESLARVDAQDLSGFTIVEGQDEENDAADDTGGFGSGVSSKEAGESTSGGGGSSGGVSLPRRASSQLEESESSQLEESDEDEERDSEDRASSARFKVLLGDVDDLLRVPEPAAVAAAAAGREDEGSGGAAALAGAGPGGGVGAGAEPLTPEQEAAALREELAAVRRAAAAEREASHFKVGVERRAFGGEAGFAPAWPHR